jgi:filamentous hemagglutinin family protein
MKQGGSRNAVFRPKLLAVSVAACFAVSASQGYAQVLPTGATGVVGVTGISQAGSTLTVNTSGNSVLNYTSFSIGAGATVQINQASAAMASLQRVVGAGGVIPQSVIDGMLKSNGRVFLLNPSGVVIGAGARIDVAGFVASSLNMSDEDFLKGRMRFTENAAAKAIKNYGEITTTSGGHVYLVAPEVENHGIIRAPQGQILLAAGKSAELFSDASPYVTVKVVADVQKALNVGQLIADSGKIGIYGALVQHSGVAEASGAVVGPGGQIRFVATKDLTIDAGSRIAANGTSGGQVLLQAEGGTNLIAGTVEAKGSTGKGGEVQALGVRVGVVGRGIIDASGEAGGGQVLVGGDYQGKNAAIQNAERTFIGPDGVIRADAGSNGDGGRVIVWADGDTRFYGHISARGGSQSGNGGFVETSGKGALEAFGRVDVRAPHGKNGTWLLDPTDLEVVAAYAGVDDAYITVYGPGVFDLGEGSTSSTVGVDAIEGYGGNVTLQATNDITFSADITKDNGGLSVLAGNSVHLKSSKITVEGSLSITASGGAITSDAPATQLVASQNVSLSGAYGVTVGGITTHSPGSTFVSANSSYGSVNTGSITATAEDGFSSVSLNAGYGGSVVVNGSLTANNSFSSGGNVNVTAADGVIVVYGNIDTRGAEGSFGNGGSVTLTRTSTGAPAGGTAVNVTGMIMTGGGSGGGANPYGGGQAGGQGGGVTISRGGYGFLSGAISVGGIDTQGGAGGATAYAGYGGFSGGNGGAGGSVAIYGYGAVGIGSINASGGAGGAGLTSFNNGGQGGSGGLVRVHGGSIAGSFFVSAGGMGGSAQGAFGGWGGMGGVLDLKSTGSIVVGTLDTSGGQGGVAPNGIGGFGAGGGSIDVSGSSVTVGLASSRGGAGGDGAEGGQGGDGAGNMSLQGTSFVAAGIVDVSGGNAGASSAGSGVGDDGGEGGFFNIGSATTDMVSLGFLKARGGDGNGTGFRGGNGGFGSIAAVTSIVLGSKPTTGQSQTVVDFSGGNGTSGANGGNGGFLDLDPISMTINGVLVGAGGSGAIQGNGGDIGFATTGGTGIITFVNGGWDLSGTVPGFISGSGVIPAQLDVAKFIFTGPGDMDDIVVTGIGTFRFTSISDPLANAVVLQQVGLTQAQDPVSGSGESQEQEETEKEKTGSLGSCRPS